MHENVESLVIEFSSPIVKPGDYESIIREFKNKVKISFSPEIPYTLAYISPTKFEIVFDQKLKLFKIYTLDVKDHDKITDTNGKPVSMRIASIDVDEKTVSVDFKGKYRFLLGDFTIKSRNTEIRSEKGNTTLITLEFNDIPDLQSLKANLSVFSGISAVKDFLVEYDKDSSK